MALRGAGDTSFARQGAVILLEEDYIQVFYKWIGFCGLTQKLVSHHIISMEKYISSFQNWFTNELSEQNVFVTVAVIFKI